jgi:SAM-dependent methyltransferase
VTKCLACEANLNDNPKVTYSRVSSVYSRSSGQVYFDLVTCQCGLLQTLPRVTGNDLLEIYEKSYAYDFHELVSREKSTRARGLSRIVQAQKNMTKVFEFGCAQGELLESFKKLGWIVSGCEIGEKSQRVCKEKGLDVVLSSAELALDNLDVTTSLFVMSHVLEHIEDPKRFLSQLAEKASPDSRLLLVVPNTSTVRGTLFAKYWGYWQVPVHITHFNKRTLTNLANSSGWRVDSCTYRSRDFMGFALTFANILGYTSRKTELGFTSNVVRLASTIWSLGYRFGRADLILILKPSTR